MVPVDRPIQAGHGKTVVRLSQCHQLQFESQSHNPLCWPFQQKQHNDTCDKNRLQTQGYPESYRRSQRNYVGFHGPTAFNSLSFVPSKFLEQHCSSWVLVVGSLEAMPLRQYLADLIDKTTQNQLKWSLKFALISSTWMYITNMKPRTKTNPLVRQVHNSADYCRTEKNQVL